MYIFIIFLLFLYCVFLLFFFFPQTYTPWVGTWYLNHWITRDIPKYIFLKKLFADFKHVWVEPMPVVLALVEQHLPPGPSLHPVLVWLVLSLSPGLQTTGYFSWPGTKVTSWAWSVLRQRDNRRACILLAPVNKTNKTGEEMWLEQPSVNQITRTYLGRGRRWMTSSNNKCPIGRQILQAQPERPRLVLHTVGTPIFSSVFKLCVYVS